MNVFSISGKHFFIFMVFGMLLIFFITIVTIDPVSSLKPSTTRVIRYSFCAIFDTCTILCFFYRFAVGSRSFEGD